MDYEFEHRGWGRANWGRMARRGDMRLFVLGVLAKKPMHGYEIIRYFEDKSHGYWRPSPGSIYPTLQMLQEEELIKGEGVDGKTVYTLTAKGREELKKFHDHNPDWSKFTKSSEAVEIRLVGADIIHQLKTIMKRQDPGDMETLLGVLTDTRDKLATMVNKQED